MELELDGLKMKMNKLFKIIKIKNDLFVLDFINFMNSSISN